MGLRLRLQTHEWLRDLRVGLRAICAVALCFSDSGTVIGQ